MLLTPLDMNRFIVKFPIAINCLVVASIAFFTARGVSNLLAMEINQALPKPKKKMVAPPLNTSPDYKKHLLGDAILARNIFDSKAGPISRIPETPPESDVPTQEVTTPTVIPCVDTRLRLKATVSRTNPEYSVANISYNKDTALYHIGDPIKEGKVVWISWQYVLIENPNDVCYLDLFETRAPALRHKQIKRGISKAGKRKRVITQKVLESILDHPEKLLKGFRARPYRKRGTTGYQLRRLKRTHPLYTLGFRKKDVITQVNGKSVQSFSQAISALNTLKKKGQTTIDFVRRRKPTSLTVQIR